MADRNLLKDPGREAGLFSDRLIFAIVACSMLASLLFIRYYYLQIEAYSTYATQADQNRLQTQPLAPRRGLIRDRNGLLIAANEPSFVLSVVVERTGGLDKVLSDIGAIIELSDEDLEVFQKRRPSTRPYAPVPLKFRISEEERARLAVNSYRLPGVVVEAQLQREYPLNTLFAHAVGYVGRINESELQSLPEGPYEGTFHIGKTGIEKYYEDLLLGTVGVQTVETDARGRIMRVVDRVPPVPGSDLDLYLDSDLQLAAANALEGSRGALVALDTDTGGVLALYSSPSFDPNAFVNGISFADYAALRDSKDVPMFNRALQGQYPPGSTVKPAIALAGLHMGLVTSETTVPDPGWYTIPGDDRRYRDWVLRIRGTGHAPKVDLHMAIAESCDVYFYDLAREMTVDRMHDFLAPFYLGQKTGIDTTNERPGVLPSTEWKMQNRGAAWYPGETLSVGIGQGYMLATPLQLAFMTSIIANRGHAVLPRFVQRINGELQEGERVELEPIDDAYWASVVKGMEAVVHERSGTAFAMSRGLSYRVAGKTGTAQVIGIAQDEEYNEDDIAERHRNHGLFIAFAPADNPTIALAVIVENGGGSSAAVPVAKAVLEVWMAKQAQAIAQAALNG